MLSKTQQQQVEDDNRTMFATVRTIREFDKSGLPWMIENPLSSRRWLTPAFKSWIKQSHVEFVPFHMFQFGSAWNKPTAVLCGNVPSHLTTKGKFCQCKGSIWGRTGEKHLQLTGTSPNGKPWTAIAQVYPKALCSALAKLLVHQVVSRLWFSQLVMHT